MHKRRFRNLIPRSGYAAAIGCAAIAVAGIILLRSESHAAPLVHVPEAPPPSSPDGTVLLSQFSGPMLHGRLALSQGAVLAHGTRTLLAELTLSSDSPKGATATRSPIALALVLDVSGSMAGEKIEQAKSAVLSVVEHMRPEDQLVLITYNHGYNVLQPLAPIASVRGEIAYRIRSIQAGGGTMIPSALEAGARNLESASGEMVRRLVLISDGLDGSGQPVGTVSQSVRSRSASGLTLSTLGIGVDYDEQFMTSLADAGRGNYEFLAGATELGRFLTKELDEATGTVCDRVVAELDLPSGVRLVRSHGAEAEGRTGTVHIPFGALFGGDSRRAVLELEVDAADPGEIGDLDVGVRYRTVADGTTQRAEGPDLALRAVSTEALVEASRDLLLFASAKSVLIDASQKEAFDAWQQGDQQRAQQIAQSNRAGLLALTRRLEQAGEADAPAARGLADLDAEYEQDESTFGAASAASPASNQYRLQANQKRRARALRRN